ncbi:MAG: type II toxin-antitoxin system VapC family toxin [Thaumarchaeota archaeon]|nr:type II toxin-antitoxin system VapC family toxin [Nitrososphaerota archaeon]
MAKNKEYVVDSSVVVKWFLLESGSDIATRLRDDFATGRASLSVPTLLFYEVMNAIRSSKLFGEADLAMVAGSLSKYKFGIWRPRGRLLEWTGELSLKEDVTVYDSCYVALAQRLGTKVITEDSELLQKFPDDTLPLPGYSRRD